MFAKVATLQNINLLLAPIVTACGPILAVVAATAATATDSVTFKLEVTVLSLTDCCNSGSCYYICFWE